MANVFRRIVTPQQRRAQLAGGRRLAPGVWTDREGGLHFSVPELLEYFNISDMPANREACVQLAVDALREQLPDANITVQDEES